MTPNNTQDPTSNLFNLTYILPTASPTSAKLGQSNYLSPVLIILSDTLYRFLLAYTPKIFFVFISLAFVIAYSACSLYFLVTIFNFYVVSASTFYLFFNSFVVRPNSYVSCLCYSCTLSYPPVIYCNFYFNTSISVF